MSHKCPVVLLKYVILHIMGMQISTMILVFQSCLVIQHRNRQKPQNISNLYTCPNVNFKYYLHPPLPHLLVACSIYPVPCVLKHLPLRSRLNISPLALNLYPLVLTSLAWKKVHDNASYLCPSWFYKLLQGHFSASLASERKVRVYPLSL